MTESILEKFDIKFSATHIGNYYFIGIDPGAGDWCAAELIIKADNSYEVNELAVLANGGNTKDSSVLYKNNDGIWIIGTKAANDAQSNTSIVKPFYENFKVPPESEYAYERYDNDLDNPNGPNKRDLMRQSFQCIVSRLFSEVNKDMSKHENIMLFVGRPSSSDWAEQEFKYRDLLMTGLKVPRVPKDTPCENEKDQYFNDENVKMVIVSEASAALASEIYKNNMNIQDLVIVIDVGSSTIDVIVVKNGSNPVEYSRQIGAGSIEANMLELMLYDDCNSDNSVTDNIGAYFSDDAEYLNIVNCKATLRNKLAERDFIDVIDVDDYQNFCFMKDSKFFKKIKYTASSHRYELRSDKEAYYNGNGMRAHPITFKDGNIENTVHKDFNDDSMKNVTENMPIFVPCTENDDIDNPYKKSYIYRSYYHAVLHFFDGIKDMYLKENDAVPQIILTGGACVMPFIRELVIEKFGVEPTLSAHPNSTVSRGLGHIAYMEVQKVIALEQINELVESVFKDRSSYLYFELRKSFATWYYEDLLQDFENWVDSSLSDTISFNDSMRTSYEYPTDNERELKVLTEWWNNENVSKIIIDSVNQKLGTLYSPENVNYEFEITMDFVEDSYQQADSPAIDRHFTNIIGFFNMFYPTSIYPKEKRRYYLGMYKNKRDKAIGYFKNQTGVSDFAKKQRDEIIKKLKDKLKETIKDYTEKLTPYIVNLK